MKQPRTEINGESLLMARVPDRDKDGEERQKLKTSVYPWLTYFV